MSGILVIIADQAFPGRYQRLVATLEHGIGCRVTVLPHTQFRRLQDGPSSHDWNLAIIDLPAPSIGPAAEMCQRIRLMMLALFAFGDQKSEKAAFAAGVDDMLAKPFSTPRLAMTVRNLLRIHALEEELLSSNRPIEAAHPL